MFWYFVLIFFAGFAAGWAFFKHRAYIKQKASDEANSLRKSIEKHI
jgi:hypothetical protein